jgi:phosphomannomutase/phosphoglucomutase
MDAQLAGLPQTVSTPELMIAVPENEKFDVMERIEQTMLPPGARLNRIDGVRAEFSDGWGLVRASNTSAALGCRFEAESEAALARIQGVFREELGRIAPGLTLPF